MKQEGVELCRARQLFGCGLTWMKLYQDQVHNSVIFKALIFKVELY